MVTVLPDLIVHRAAWALRLQKWLLQVVMALI